MLYAAATTAVGITVAMSRIVRRLAALPIGLLIGVQAFRLPLEMILNRFYTDGDLPVQMTWSGLNFDVVTGISAALLGLLSWKRPIPRWAAWAWNLLGSALLMVVVAIAVMSAPTPLRRFSEDPPVLLAFHFPFNWILSVHVWTALVGHLVLFRALHTSRD